ncbi:hypothetical protein M758_4G188100 [Ceratodon purpureus]|uniref:Secreted protein n=1 Tax=Ceratodon purpureus TaxID=3225 RepID=A0A8T0ICM4_CERPU|nr:hypothetical protein KC19_4G185200 [Ceratodon purpureus]KAG0620085.1 hypothetical protein M758_4G188100 [Ceratodon purpureus]
MVHYRRCNGLYITLVLASLFQRLFEQYSSNCAFSKDITIAPHPPQASGVAFKSGNKNSMTFLHFGEVIS